MGEMRFQPLKIKRLSEIIEDSIKDLILTGELKIGDRLPTEKKIGIQFNVSTVTVREALRGLESLGIIKKKRGKGGGIFISQASSSIVKSAMHSFLSSKKFSARDIGVVRSIIEPANARIATMQITPGELKLLEKNIIYCEKKIAKKKDSLSTKDFFDIEDRNVEFHRLIAESTHNSVLLLTVDYVEDFLLSFKKSTLTPDIRFCIETVDRHRKIYNYMKNGDAQAAEQSMLEHITLVGNYLISKEQNIK